MLAFILRRMGTIALTMLCLTMIVFFMINLEPNLKKLAISQLDMRSPAEQIESWLVKNGYGRYMFMSMCSQVGLGIISILTRPSAAASTRVCTSAPPPKVAFSR